MKKTLIAILALAGIASAVDMEDALLITTAGETDLSTLQHTSNQYTLTIKLNSAGIDMINNFVGSRTPGMDISLVSIGLTSQAATEGAVAANHLYGMGMGYSSSGGVITTGGFYNTKEATPATGTTSHFNGGGNHLFSDAKYNENLTGVAITLYGLNGQSKPAFTATMAHADGSTESVNSLTYTGNAVTSDPVLSWSTLYLNTQYVENAWLFDGMRVNNQATAQELNLKAIAVPEPATGTLSLLALAGLCARRRRK